MEKLPIRSFIIVDIIIMLLRRVNEASSTYFVDLGTKFDALLAQQ